MSKVCTKCYVEKALESFSFRNVASGKQFEQCKECTNKYAKKYRTENALAIKQKNQQWYEKSGREWKQNYEVINKERINQTHRDRYQNDVQFRLKRILRSRFQRVMKSTCCESSMQLLGCPLSYFKKWLEYQFDPQISWENYGSLWDIDHVRPCSSFDLTKLDDIEMCFHWSNMQPLRKKENYSKNATVDVESIKRHQIIVQAFTSINPVPSSHGNL